MRPSRRLGFASWRPLVVGHDDPWLHRVRRSSAANSVASCRACRASRRACKCQQLLGHARAIQPRDVYILHACWRNRDLTLGYAACVRSFRGRVSLRGACAAFCGAGVAEGAGSRVVFHLLGSTLPLLHLWRAEGPKSCGVAFSTWAEYLFPGVGGDQMQEPSVLSEFEALRLAS